MLKPEQVIEELKSGTVGVLGVPFDRNSSFQRGAAQAPPRIRESLNSSSTNLCTENVLDLSIDTGWRDLGDLELPNPNTAFEMIERTILRLLSRKSKLIALGGDHSITYPILRAYAQSYPSLTILHLDAHPDLYEELDGNRYSHACPFARIMEEKLAARLVQVGIRTMTPHQKEQAKRFSVEVIEMRHWHKDQLFAFKEPVFLSLDMDCLDPAFAPGVSHQEPGGLSTREVLGIIQQMKGRVVGADIVEYNPNRDAAGMTAMVAAKLLKELLARMLG
ncbi:MAG: agmatinase [Planctomycetes bacterium]|nr:agmatinase [Planctomycetota bacterium]